MGENDINKSANKKKKNLLYILAALIVIVVLLLGGYFIFNNKNNSNNNANNNKKINNAEKSKIEKIITNELGYMISVNKLSELNDDDLSYMAMYKYNNGDIAKNDRVSMESLKESVNNSSLANIGFALKPIKDFGPNGIRRNDDVEDLFYIENDTYIKTDVAHGDVYLKPYMINPKLTVTDDVYTFSCNYIFRAITDEPEDANLYYNLSDYITGNPFDTIAYSDKLDKLVSSYIKNNSKKFESKLSTYNYVFTKSNNNYYLTDYYMGI